MAYTTGQGRDYEGGRHHFNSRPSPASPPSNNRFPRYFLVRPDVIKHTASDTVTTKGPMVPLIPIDQLPFWLDIAGVPRELATEQLKYLHNVGESSKDFDAYEVHLRHHGESGARGNRIATELGSIKYERMEASNDSEATNTVHGVVDACSLDSSQKMIEHHGNEDSSSDPQSEYSSDDKCITKAEETDSNSSRNLATSPVLSEAYMSASSSTDKEILSSLRPPKGRGIDESRHAPGNAVAIVRKQSPPSPTVALNPRIPLSLPARPRGHYNPYNTLHRNKRHVPSTGGHPADRLKKSPSSSSRYSPLQPSRSLTAASQRSSPKYDVPGNHHPAGSTTTAITDHNHEHGRSSTFCRHWCHHNTCKYGDECMYVHEMPQTREGLGGVGLYDWPKWYKAERAGYEKARAEMRQSMMSLDGPVLYPTSLMLGPPSAPFPSGRVRGGADRPRSEREQHTELRSHGLEQHRTARDSKRTRDHQSRKQPSLPPREDKALSSSSSRQQRSYADHNLAATMREEDRMEEEMKMARVKAVQPETMHTAAAAGELKMGNLIDLE